MTLYRSASAAGVSHGHRKVSEADHWILALDPPPWLACTHLVSAPYPHVAVSLVGAGAPATAPELAAAAEEARTGRSGRAVLFPGVDRLVGTLTVGEVLARSAIDRVEVLGAGVAEQSVRLDTRDFVRPQYRDGDLVLIAMPSAGGVLVPFEIRDPTPCCANH